MKRIFLAMSAVILLVGCSSQEKLSQDDICIQRTDDKAKICYGMERAEVEKVAGKGDHSTVSPKSFRYGNGLSVTYRNNKVVGLRVSDGSYYEHISGVKIGDLPNKLKDKYGSASEERVGSIAYIYDVKDKKMIQVKNDEPIASKGQDREDLLIVNAATDKNGYVSMWILGDLEAVIRAE